MERRKVKYVNGIITALVCRACLLLALNSAEARARLLMNYQFSPYELQYYNKIKLIFISMRWFQCDPSL